MFRLKFTNPWGEKFFFVRLGEQWAKDPRYRYIDATTPDAALARLFDTEEDANAAWSEAGKPRGWETEGVT